MQEAAGKPGTTPPSPPGSKSLHRDGADWSFCYTTSPLRGAIPRNAAARARRPGLRSAQGLAH
jgi:hypothetical protein